MSGSAISLPNSPDLEETGVRELLHSLAHPARQLFFHSFDAMRLRVANNIGALALRRYLAEQEVPHQLAAPISFTEEDQYDLVIGGRRCIPAVQLVCADQAEGDIYLPDQRGGSLYRDVDLYRKCGLKASAFSREDEKPPDYCLDSTTL